jgi:hypothetical protein
MSFIEKQFGDNEEPISEITGIEAEHLPPSEKLTDEEKSILATELENLLQYFNFKLDFPETLPAHLKYPVIFNFWKEKQVAVSFGRNNIELCDMEIENCPFPGYCKTCDEVAAQLKFDEETSSTSTDFDIKIEDLLPSPEEIEILNKEAELYENENESEQVEEINGLYNDNGEKIDPQSVPIPNLCIICKQHQSEDWEENLLCLMNRHDQMKNDNFICAAFKKI